MAVPFRSGCRWGNEIQRRRRRSHRLKKTARQRRNTILFMPKKGRRWNPFGAFASVEAVTMVFLCRHVRRAREDQTRTKLKPVKAQCHGRHGIASIIKISMHCIIDHRTPWKYWIMIYVNYITLSKLYIYLECHSILSVFLDWFGLSRYTTFGIIPPRSDFDWGWGLVISLRSIGRVSA